MEFSYYKAGEMTKTEKNINLKQLCSLIKELNVSDRDYHMDVIDECKELYVKYLKSGSDKEKKAYQKHKLENFAKVTFAGTFRSSQRLRTSINDYTNIICIDIDGFKTQEEIQSTLDKINSDEYTFASFRSPSNYGIKILVRVNCPTRDVVVSLDDFYTKSYSILSKYYLDKYSVVTDSQASDISRLCYIPYDENLFINKSASIYQTYQTIFDESKKALNKTTNNNKRQNKKVSNNIGGSAIDILADLSKQNNIQFNYGEWMSLGFIIYHELGEQGLDLYKSFSKNDSSYDEKEIESKWLSISNSYDPEKKNKPTVKRLAEILRTKGVIIDKAIMKENDLSYNDNDLSFLIANSIGKCYMDEFKSSLWIKRNDILLALNNPIRNQMIIDIKKQYIGCTKQNLEIYFESEQNIELFNPVKDKLNSIKTDDSTEFNKLSEYFNFLDDTEIQILKIKKWMLGVLTMIFEDGKHFDSMLIFLGRQDGGKTFFVRDQMLKIFKDLNHICEKFKYDEAASVDMQKMLARNVIVLDDESTFSKKEAGQIKTILSSKDLQFVDKYEKDITNKRRLGAFIGTTNNQDIYDDETGGKRFHVIDLGESYLPGAIVSGKLMKKEFPLDWENIWGYIYDLFIKGLRHSDIEYVNNNKDYQKRTVLEKLVFEYFEIFNPKKQQDFRKFREIRMEVHNIANQELYNIRNIIDSPRGLSSALNMVFGSELKKYVPSDKKDTFYNIRLKSDARKFQNFTIPESGLTNLFNN